MEKIEVGDIFTLMDENDQEQEIEVLGALTLDGIEYVAVAFADEIDEDAVGEDIDVFFLRVEDGDQLSIIESDEEFDQVSAAFKEYGDEE